MLPSKPELSSAEQNIFHGEMRQIIHHEQENFDSISDALSEQMLLCSKIRSAYKFAKMKISAGQPELYGQLYGDSVHHFNLGIITLLRGHILGAMGETRSAIEATAYMGRIASCSDDNSRDERVEIFANREDDHERFRKVFSTGHLFSEKDGTDHLKISYDIACNGAHPNSVGHAFRTHRTTVETFRSFFDEGHNGSDNYRRYGNTLLLIMDLHINILKTYANLLPDGVVLNKSDWVILLEDVSHEFSEKYSELRA